LKELKGGFSSFDCFDSKARVPKEHRSQGANVLMIINEENGTWSSKI
jgi:hypothetical protein